MGFSGKTSSKSDFNKFCNEEFCTLLPFDNEQEINKLLLQATCEFESPSMKQVVLNS